MKIDLLKTTLRKRLVLRCAAPLVVCVLSTLVSMPAFAKVDSETVSLNNSGVKALNANNFELASKTFEEAIKRNPDYKLAEQNLAITHNNWGLNICKKSPWEALKHFHQSLYLDPLNQSTQQNLDYVLTALGKNPNSFQDRALLGLEAKLDGDLRSAVIEFRAALTLKPDQEISRKLDEVLIVLDQKLAKRKVHNDADDVDFGPYMTALQTAIKRNWFPPKSSKSEQIVVLFKISSSGAVSDLSLKSSSGVQSDDDAALSAVTAAAPFPDLPKGAEEPTSIAFTFDYNPLLAAVNLNDRLENVPDISNLPNIRATAHGQWRPAEENLAPSLYGIPLAFDYMPRFRDPAPEFPKKELPIFDDKSVQTCRGERGLRAW